LADSKCPNDLSERLATLKESWESFAQVLCFKNEDIKIVATFQSLVHRQQYDEVRAVYLSGQCRLSKEFKKFEIDSLLPWFTRKSKAYRKISFLSS